MKIAGEYTFDAPQEMVWEAVQDPDVLGSILPGGEGIEEVGENEYSGNLKIKVGPVNGTFKGNIKLSDIVAPESYNIAVDGKGAPGFVKATGSLKLTGQGDQTQIDYEGNAQVGGRIASVGQRLLDASAKSIVRQSLEALNEYLKVQMAAQQVADSAEEGMDQELAETAVSTPEYKPPSQTQLAANVARDVANDLIPERYRIPVAIGVVAAILLILYLIFG